MSGNWAAVVIALTYVIGFAVGATWASWMAIREYKKGIKHYENNLN